MMAQISPIIVHKPQKTLNHLDICALTWKGIRYFYPTRHNECFIKPSNHLLLYSRPISDNFDGLLIEKLRGLYSVLIRDRGLPAAWT